MARTDLNVQTHLLPADEACGLPNNPHLPLLVYPGVFIARDGEPLAGRFEQRYAASGWTGTWRNGVYPFHHYHSNAHEALAIARGHATLQLGGPGGVRLNVQTGDALVLPAGTAHKRINASGDLLVIGAYPPGQSDYDLLREGSADQIEQAKQRIAATPLPPSDPFFGEGGPLLQQWRTAS